MRKCISTYYLALNREIDLTFTFQGCFVDTITTIPSPIDRGYSEYGYLSISIEFELKDYEALSDAPIFTRSRYLSLLGILSFLTNELFDVFLSSSGSTSILGATGEELENLQAGKPNKLLIDNIDMTENLDELISNLRNLNKRDQNVVSSLLDRWRKARYMEIDSVESFLYEDESTLAYFHILEILGDLYSEKLVEKSDNLIKNFTNTFNSDVLSLSRNALDDKNRERTKLLQQLLNKDISVTAKILFLLKEIKLYDDQTAFWIRNLVDERNSVAHGRSTVYYEKAIFPVKPFFPLILKELYPLEYLRVLTARAISSHMGLSLYRKEWDEVKKFLIDDNFKIKVFLDKGDFREKNLTEDDEKTVFGGVNYHLISKKLKPKLCINFYKFYLSIKIEDEKFLCCNVDGLVILFESVQEKEFEELLKSAIVNVHRMDCNPYSKFRDMRYFLNFHNIESPKLEALIANRVVR